MPVDISLIMPVWQPRRDWLREAVRSALNQAGCDLELLVVDDGNPEPIAALLSDIDDERVRHIRIAHQGVCAARNAGIDESRGRFLRFIDADDVLEPGSTRRLRAVATPTTISYEDTVVCDENLIPQYTISCRISGDATIPCLLGEFEVRHCSMLFPIDVVHAAGKWNTRLRIGEDFDFVLRCLEHSVLAPGGGTATFYRRHDRSATASLNAFLDGQNAARLAVEEFFTRNPQLAGTPTMRNVWRIVHLDGVNRALALRRPFLAMKLAVPLVRVAPWASLRVLLITLRTAAAIGVRAAARKIRARGSVALTRVGQAGRPRRP